MPSHLYTLNASHEVVPCDNLLDWATWMEHADKQVAYDEANGIRVSTVFLGLAAPFSNHMFETALFSGGELLDIADRYATWDEAVKGHAEWLRKVKEEWPKSKQARAAKG